MPLTFVLAAMDPFFITLLISAFFVATICCAGIRRNPQPGIQYAQLVPNDLAGGTIYESPLKLEAFQSVNGSEYYSYQKGITTLYENFKEACRKHRGQPYLGKSAETEGKARFQWLTYGEVEQLVNNVATSLHYWDGIRRGSKVGIYSINRIEWMLLDHACSAMSAVSVPIGYEQVDEHIIHICNETEMEIIFINNKKNLEKLVSLSSQIPSLKKIVMFDEVPVIKTSLRVASFDSYLEANNFSPSVLETPNINTWFTICYTSGTTGKPKGVIHTHGNFMAELAAVLVLSDSGRMIIFDSKIVHLSYLPLNHIFERIVQHALIVAGGRCGFFCGDRKKISENAKALKPTLFVAVPKVLSTVYDKIMKGIQEKCLITRTIFQWTFQNRIAKFKSGTIKKNFWEKLVFRSITKALGGQVQAIVTGAAALDPKYIEFYQAIFEHCIQGYGQTETCGAVSTAWLQDTTGGHVGGILPGMQFRLKEPENTGEKSGDLELCVRGPVLSPGYFWRGNAVVTFTEEHGWYRTGDVATILPNGAIHIEGRLGDIVKLSTGHFVNVSKIATILEESEHYSQICVTAESFFNCPVAIVVPKGIPNSKAAFIKTVLDEFMSFIERKDHKKLAYVEVPQAVVIATRPFSEESRELTDSQKIKRKVIHGNYRNEIAQAYESYLNSIQNS